MTIVELGALGELVGTIAVVVSLFCLALQVHSNTRSLNANAYQQAAIVFNDVVLIPTKTPEIADILLR